MPDNHSPSQKRPSSNQQLPVVTSKKPRKAGRTIDTEKVDYRRCICSSAKCETLRREVLQIVNKDHSSGKNNGFTEIRHQKDSFSFHVEALRRNVVFHLKVDKSDALAKIYYVASIHWPAVLLDGVKFRLTPLSNEKAIYYDKLCGYHEPIQG